MEAYRFQARNAFIITQLLVGIRASNEHNIGPQLIFRSFGSANTAQVDVSGDDLLAAEMAAALGEHLVFDVEASHVGPDVLLDCQRDCIGTCL